MTLLRNDGGPEPEVLQAVFLLQESLGFTIAAVTATAISTVGLLRAPPSCCIKTLHTLLNP